MFLLQFICQTCQLRFPTCCGRSWSHCNSITSIFTQASIMLRSTCPSVPTPDPQWAQMDLVSAKSFSIYAIDSSSYRLLSHIRSFFNHFPVHGPPWHFFWTRATTKSFLIVTAQPVMCHPKTSNVASVIQWQCTISVCWMLLGHMESGRSKTKTPSNLN